MGDHVFKISSASRTVLAAVVAATLAAGLLVAATNTAAQAASCKGVTCSGRSPSTYGCRADAVTKRYWLVPEGPEANRVSEKYSAKCQAVWVEVKLTTTLYGWAWGRIDSKYKPQGESSFYTRSFAYKRTTVGTGWSSMAPFPAGTSQSSRFCWDTGNAEPVDCSTWK